jgi:hypothetical protein
VRDTFIDATVLDRLIARLRAIENMDPRPLLNQWAAILVEDNRIGVLSGLNKDGEPVTPPLVYRNGRATRDRSGASGLAPRAVAGNIGRGRGSQYRPHYQIKAGHYRIHHQGRQTLANNNLSSSEYQKLTGPFAAPRRASSRVITNFVVQTPRQIGGRWRWVIRAGWKDVVDASGRPFYPSLFAPPGRDMRGIRPTALQKCRAAMMKWVAGGG